MLRTLAIVSNQIVLSFGVFDSFLITKAIQEWGRFPYNPRSPFYTYYISFRSSGSQESNTLNGVQIGAKTKKLWPFEDNRTKFSENFATAKSACENFTAVKSACEINLRKSRKLFHSWKITWRHTCATSQVQIPFLQLRIKLRNHLQAANQVVKSSPSCGITSKLRNHKFNLRNFTSCI